MASIQGYIFMGWWCLTTFIFGSFVNLLQLLVLPLFWLHRKSYHFLINKLAYLIYAHLTFLAEWWGHFQLHVYTDTPQQVLKMREENILVVFNHSALDWLGAYVLTERVNCTAHTRVLMKHVVKFLPVVGFNLWFCEYGFLSRNWSKDETSLHQFIQGCQQATSPFIVSLCPEGTRLTKEKLAAGQEYARENNLPILNHHLVPRTKGFARIAKSLRSHVDAIYDCEFAFPDAENATMGTLIGRGTVAGHLNIRRIPIAEFECSTEEEASQYLMELFVKKDKCMEHFHENNKFNAPLLTVRRGAKNLVTFGASSLFTACVLVFAVRACVRVCSYDTMVLIGVISSTLLLLTVCVGYWLASPSRSSSFGLKKKDT